jgi:tRNA pseudouridine13 synthase
MNLETLPRSFGEPVASGCFPAMTEDFQVDEVLGFEPDGTGQHVLVQIRKQNCNTEWLARQLQKVAGVRHADVSYAGLKDRHAVTSQWFSVDLAGRPEPDWTQLESAQVQLLTVARHQRKLRRGTLQGNRFVMRIRDIRGDRSAMVARLEQLKNRGVPNYFGKQRFGADNIGCAEAMFAGARKVRDRHLRGLYLSAVRALLFNKVLARRVSSGTWDTPIDGDAMALDGSRSFFVIDAVDEVTVRRSAARDIHPTGPLWGRGEIAPRLAAHALEQSTLVDDATWRDGLERFGCVQQRRALRSMPAGLVWEFGNDSTLELRFQLSAGSYATVVLREIIGDVAA